MISYGKQSIDQSDIDAVVEVLKSDMLTQGSVVNEFEDHLKQYFGSEYACSVSNGTAALHLTALALDWKKNDIIITTPISFLATSNAILYCGAVPEFVDINSISYTIDIELLERKIINLLKRGKKTKAVIGVDYAGHPCDWQELRALADKYNFQLVNDNCHALGAEYFGDKNYAVKYADVVTQSYHPVKHITTGEGGAILTNNLEIDSKVRLLRTHGVTKDPNFISGNHGSWYYEMHELGFNYRITDFQCALGISQLSKLDIFLNKRRMVAKKYDNLLADKFLIPNVSPKANHAYHLYPLQINFEKLEISKIEFFSDMKKVEIGLQVHYIPIHLQPYYKRHFGFSVGDFPESEKFYNRQVSLPIYPGLHSKDLQYVSDNIIKYFR